MTKTPLTNRALERIRGICAGNGIEPANVSVLTTDEAEYTLRAELSFNARWELELAKPEEIKNLHARELPNAQSLNELASSRPYPATWWRDAMAEVKGSPVGNGTGWGADGLTVVLPAYTELYNVQELCRTCRGDKNVTCPTCDGSAEEDCWHCNRSGLEPGSPNQPCTVCKGERKAECRTCKTHRMVVCPGCKGQGKKTTVYALRFTASTRFSYASNSEVPSAMRRALDRAGMAKLANGHAAIQQLPFDEDLNPLAPTVRFTATLPFASASFNIDGHPHTAELLGLRTAILEMKPFLDNAAMQAYNNATLHQLRLFQEAQATVARRGAITDFQRNYPVGLSKDVAEKVFQVARQSLHDMLTRPRRLGGVIGVAAAVLLSVLYFYGPLRSLAVLDFGLPVKLADTLLPLVTALLFLFGLQFYCSRQLQKRLNNKTAQAGLINRTALSGMFAVIVLHFFIMVTMPEPPHWYLLERLKIMVWLENLGREE